MPTEFTIQQIRDFVNKDYPSVSAKFTKSALQHYDERVKSDGWIPVKGDLPLPPPTNKHYYWLYQEDDNRIIVGEYDYAEDYFVDSAMCKVYGITHFKIPVGPNGKLLELKEEL
jgi:hypothetical protein